MIHYRYTLKDFEQWVDGLAELMNAENDQHYVQLPPLIGSGYIYAKMMNEAMSFLVINVVLNEEMILERQSLDEMNLLLYFTDIDTPNSYSIQSQNENLEINNGYKRKSVFLSSANYQLQIRYSKQTTLKLTGIHFKSSLVRKFVKKDVFHYLNDYSQLGLKTLENEPIAADEKKLLDEIYGMDTSNEFGKLVLYNRVLLLVEKTMKRFLLTELPSAKSKRLLAKDMDGLKEIEYILSEKNLDNFPSVQELSRIALMSSSKLKRRFKEVYGMKLYEFYNYNRLKKARQWIQTGESNIKDAAYRIGFSNLSNFSKAFKKEFGILPSELRTKDIAVPTHGLKSGERSFGTAN
jgi:AraC-like DNA-binding protein